MSNQINWKKIKEEYGLTPVELSDEITTTAQAMLALQLMVTKCDSVILETEQLGKKYRLTFEEIKGD